MKRWTSRLRNFLILGIILAAWAAVWLVRKQPPTQIGCSPTDNHQSYPFEAFVALNFKEFQPSGNQFVGSFSMEAYPRDGAKIEDIRKSMESLKKVSLELYHYDDATKSYISRGGSDEAIDLKFPPAISALRGKGTFNWSSEAGDRGAFYYPFDHYVLQLNTWLLDATNPDEGNDYQIQTFAMDFGNSNFVPHLTNLHAQSPYDSYRITVERPFILRVIAIIVGVLLIFWLGYLLWVAKPDEHVGQIVSLFVGVFSIRSSLLSGAPVFPSLIDYFALSVYLSAVLIVLLKWLLPIKNSKECPLCKSSINSAATVCPQCTREISPA